MSNEEERDSGGVGGGGGAGPGGAPSPRDLPAFLPHAIKQLQAPFTVRVSCHPQDEYIGDAGKRRRSARSRAVMPVVATSDSSKEESLGPGDEEDTALQLAAVLDAAGALVELAARGASLPCMLLKLLALCAPLQPRLARLTLRACRLDARALHQLVALLPASRVSEVCLDDSRLRAGGFHLLLQPASCLARLSLDRCVLGDAGAAALAAELHHPRPAAATLRSLSLASNGIGDVGARALGEALRSNRTLQHLNLASNRITDVGAAAIFDSLAEFEVTAEETLAARRRTMERLRRRQSVFARVLAELEAERLHDPSRCSSANARRKSRKAVGGAESGVNVGGASLAVQAEAATRQLMGTFSEPLGAENTELRSGVRYSAGDAALCWLNLAYNSLGQASLEALARTLAAQARAREAALAAGAAGAPGLLRVALDGNPLPASAELAELGARLEEALGGAGRRPGRRPTLAVKSLLKAQKN